MSQAKKLLLLSAVASKSPDEVTGLWQWLKSDAGITKDGSNFVSSWADQSGGARDMTQATVGIKPKWVDGASYNTLLPVIRFDGDDYMNGGAIGPAGGTDPRCIMACVSSVAPEGSGYNHLLHYGTDQAGQAYGLTTLSYASHTGGLTGPGNHYWNAGMAGSAACPTSVAVLTVYFDGTTDKLRVNGSQVASSTPTINTVTNVHYRIGGRVGTVGEYLSSDLCEVLVYAPAPSLADIQALEAYLTDRWF